MKKVTALSDRIESAFRMQVQKDRKASNAYLLVHSDKLGVDLNVAEGMTDHIQANIHQPNHVASVGKLFTAALVSMFCEQHQLDFNDPIAKYLDADLMNGLHVYKGKEYSDQITIRHLLMQKSGLNDVFYRLYQKVIKELSNYKN
jgi:D-alanyl-D-alanine carboxypeptidase